MIYLSESVIVEVNLRTIQLFHRVLYTQVTAQMNYGVHLRATFTTVVVVYLEAILYEGGYHKESGY